MTNTKPLMKSSVICSTRSRSRTTGNYTLPSLPAGGYELRIEIAGFKRFLAPEVQVQVSQTTRVDATLEIGAASESVTVSDQAPILRTENAEQSTNISGELVNS